VSRVAPGEGLEQTAAGSTLAIPSPSRRSHRHAASGLAARGWQSSGNSRQTAQMQGSAAAETSSALPDSEQSADAGSAWAGSGQERAQVRGGAGSVGASVPSRKQFLFNQMIRSSYHRLVSRIIGRASSGRGRRVLRLFKFWARLTWPGRLAALAMSDASLRVRPRFALLRRASPPVRVPAQYSCSCRTGRLGLLRVRSAGETDSDGITDPRLVNFSVI
jgi:hypothetical protein